MATKRTRSRKKSDKGVKHFNIGSPLNGKDSALVLIFRTKGGEREYQFSKDCKNVRNRREMWSETIGMSYLIKLFTSKIEVQNLEFAVIQQTSTDEVLWKWSTHLKKWQTPPQYEATKLELEAANNRAVCFKMGSPKNGNNSKLILSFMQKGGEKQYCYSQDCKDVRDTPDMWSEQIGLQYLGRIFEPIKDGNLQFAAIWRIETKTQLYQWNIALQKWQTVPQYREYVAECENAAKLTFVDTKKVEKQNAMFRLWLPLSATEKEKQKVQTGSENIVTYAMSMDNSEDGTPFSEFRATITKNKNRCDGKAAQVFCNKTNKFLARIDVKTLVVNFL